MKSRTLVDVGTLAIAFALLSGLFYGILFESKRTSEKIPEVEVPVLKNYLEWKELHPEFGNLYDASMVKDGYATESRAVQ